MFAAVLSGFLAVFFAAGAALAPDAPAPSNPDLAAMADADARADRGRLSR